MDPLAVARVYADIKAVAVPGKAPARPPMCQKCQGAGRVYGPVNLDNPWGPRSIPCPVCGPHRAAQRLQTSWPIPPAVLALADKKIKVPGLPPLDDPTYAERERDHTAIFQALHTMRQLLTEWPGITVVIDGNNGTAKTHMLAWVYSMALKTNRWAIYATATAIEGGLTRFDNPEDATPYSRKQDLEIIDVLLVDEADRYSHDKLADEDGDGNTYFERQYLEIIKKRDGHRRLTVLACNKGRTELHPTIRSLASSGCWIDLSGVTDMRPHFGRKWEPKR